MFLKIVKKNIRDYKNNNIKFKYSVFSKILNFYCKNNGKNYRNIAIIKNFRLLQMIRNIRNIKKGEYDIL